MIVLGGYETSPSPESSSFEIYGIHHERSSANESCCLNAALQSMFHQARADPHPSPFEICGKLTQQQARHGIGRLASTDRTRQNVRDDRGRCEPIVADDAASLMNDQHGRETLLLVRERAILQPVIEYRLAAVEGGHIVGSRQRFGMREYQFNALRFPAPRARRVGSARPFREPALPAPRACPGTR